MRFDPFPFRLSANRTEATKTEHVFAYGGMFGASALPTYACTDALNNFEVKRSASHLSVKALPASAFPLRRAVRGLRVTLTEQELARLDSYADLRGWDVHRFSAVLASGQRAWVYQSVADATEDTVHSSHNPSLFRLCKTTQDTVLV